MKDVLKPQKAKGNFAFKKKKRKSDQAFTLGLLSVKYYPLHLAYDFTVKKKLTSSV